MVISVLFSFNRSPVELSEDVKHVGFGLNVEERDMLNKFVKLREVLQIDEVSDVVFVLPHQVDVLVELFEQLQFILNHRHTSYPSLLCFLFPHFFFPELSEVGDAFILDVLVV